MKKSFHTWLSGIISLSLCILFALIFISYWHPMKNSIYDLSLEIAEGEIPRDVSAERGWTVFTQTDSHKQRLGLLSLS